MKKIHIKRDIEAYKNLVLKKTLELKDPVSFFIPTKLPYTAKFLDLYFSKQNKEGSGTLIATVAFSDEDQISYRIPFSQIRDHAPLRFEFGGYKEVEKGISIKLNVRFSEHPLCIWMNERGPCCLVEAIEDRVFDVKATPVISLITPVYKTDMEILKKTAESVLNQVYKDWEWVIVDDGSNDTRLTNYLKNIAKDDERIKVIHNKENKGIARASNDAIDNATGAFVALLDHDDLITKEALLEVSLAFNEDSEVDFIYSDEDKVTEDGGQLFGEFRKPDWNYPMFLSHMYTCHLVVFRTSLIKEIKGFREGFDGSQDYDLVLRVIEKTKKIKHIPKILYHWRICKGSTSEDISNKPQARINAVRAITDHLSRIGKSDAIVQAGPFPGHYFIDYMIRKRPYPNVHIFVSFKDNVNCVLNLKYSMAITDYPNYRITFVNNGSSEDTLKKLSGIFAKHEITMLHYKEPFNFSAINNFAVKKNKEIYNEYCDYYLFLNDDIEIMHPEWLTQMVKQAEARPEVAVVGAKLLYANHKIQHAGIFVGINGVAGVSHKMIPDSHPGYYSRPHIVQDITAVTGACMLVRAKAFHEIKGFNEELPKAFNDVDLCLRLIKKGWKVVYTPYARLYHHESVSRGKDSMEDKEFQKYIKYMEDKWNVSKYMDPYYNPNLPFNCEGNVWS